LIFNKKAMNKLLLIAVAIALLYYFYYLPSQQNKPLMKDIQSQTDINSKQVQTLLNQ
jgi:hypothetical protein